MARANLYRRVVAASVLSITWMAAQPNDPVTEWVRGNAIRLTTPEAGHGFKDMEPLKKVVGKARIVSLGEATHGSREFFQLKHRMLEFLARDGLHDLFDRGQHAGSVQAERLRSAR